MVAFLIPPSVPFGGNCSPHGRGAGRFANPLPAQLAWVAASASRTSPTGALRAFLTLIPLKGYLSLSKPLRSPLGGFKRKQTIVCILRPYGIPRKALCAIMEFWIFTSERKRDLQILSFTIGAIYIAVGNVKLAKKMISSKGH